MTYEVRKIQNRSEGLISAVLSVCKSLTCALAISLALSGCALTRSPRLAEPEPFKPNTSSISEPVRSSLSLIPLNIDFNNSQSNQIYSATPSGQEQKDINSNVREDSLPMVYLLKISEPIRSRLKFPASPVMLAAMKSCGKISDSSRNEGFVRQLFVGWKGARGVAVRSLEFQGHRVAIARGRGEIAGAPVSVLALTRLFESCVFDLTIWSEDESLLEISSEAISSLGTALVNSQG